jgi:cobalt/nickel transport system permease protein
MHHLYIDEYCGLDSFVHRLKPQVKAVTFFAFILFLVFTPARAYPAFCLYACLLLVILLASKLPLRYVFTRSLSVIPFVLVVALFIPFLKKGQVAGGYSLGSLRLNLTYEGIYIFWNILIKAYLSGVCVILLAGTTKFSLLLKALGQLRLPRVIIMVMSFMYRYIFVIADELMQMRLAKDSRTVAGSRWFHAKALSSMLGVLFIRSYEKGESVYLAMCSRGFDGEIRVLGQSKAGAADIIFAAVVISVLACIRVFAV